MDSVLVGSLVPRFSQLGLPGGARSRVLHARAASVSPAQVMCGLRGAGPRKHLWRGRLMSSEAIQAVHALKLARSSRSSAPSARLEDVFVSRIGRLLKADVIAVRVGNCPPAKGEVN